MNDGKLEKSVFKKMADGEIAVDKIYEDERTFAFLDIEPLSDGHVLVVSKAQVDPLWELTDEDYVAMWATARKVARRVQEVLKPARVGCVVEGFGVAHAHIHVVPLYSPDVLRLHHGYPVRSSEAEMREISNKLRF